MKDKQGHISFVGAGPGAPDLITLRGAARLAAADVVIYAGSLVNEKLLETAPRAVFYNSALLALPDVLELLVSHYRAGRRVVRLHTGDPAMYGAVSEQYRELDLLGIPYEVVPGVSSVFAAAAALKTELTMPGLSQSVILTREAGRTPVPEAEALEKLAAHGTTLCLFLSVADLSGLAGRLLAAGRPATTPVAVVYRASWENEQIVRGTLADIAEKTVAAGIKRQAMIVIGEVLSRNGDLSRLYDRNFTTGYRHGTDSRGGFRGRVALMALTRRGVWKAAEIAAGLEDATLILPEKFRADAPAMRLETYPDGDFAAAFRAAWPRFDGLVMVMAAGIVVRQLAGVCADKKHDPAVAVCDEAGNYAVSLLSGHVGGANALATDVARITGGRAVITTASDVRHYPAWDEFAARRHYRIEPPESLTMLASAMLEEQPVELEMPRRICEEDCAGLPFCRLVREREDGVIMIRAGGRVWTLFRERFVLGVGCRRGVSAARIAAVAERVLERHGVTRDEVAVIASAEVKKDEAGLTEWAASWGRELRLFPAAALNAVAVPNPSSAAERHLALHSVSEAAALLAAGPSGRLVVEKTADADVTVALAAFPAPDEGGEEHV